MKARKLLISILTGLCICLISATILTACEEEHTHSYTQQITTEVTCTEKGVLTYTCSCNDSYTEEIPALGHEYVPHKVQAATCLAIGWDEYNTCSRCDYTTYVEIPALNHDKIQHNAQAATCTEIGWNAYETCSRCSYTTYMEIPATGEHSWNDGEITTQPTCKEKGVKTFTCTICAITTYTEEVPENGHNYESATTAPTCTQQGYTTYTCTVCDDTYVDDYTTALGHTDGEIVIENEVVNTCTTDGSYENVVYCTVCNVETSRDTITVAKLGHNYEGVTTAPTCTAQGFTTYTCTICDDTYVGDYTTALGHTNGDAVIENEIANTCTTDGSYNSVVYCTVCSTEVSRETITVDKLGHNYEGVTTAPTCTAQGYTTYACTVCGDNYTADYTIANGHIDGKTVVENEVSNTCTTDGSYDNVIYCAVCGEELGREIIIMPATHQYSNSYCNDYHFHWKKCINCAYITEKVEHTLDEDGICITCEIEFNLEYVLSYYGYYVVAGIGNCVDNEIVIKATYKGLPVKEIANSAFLECTQLTSITIPNSITYIRDNAFYGCTNLSSVHYNGEIEDWCRITFEYSTYGGYTYYSSYANPMMYAERFYIDETEIKELIIPNSITAIKEYAFYGFKNIEKITIPNSVISIGAYAFANCSSVKELLIPNTITILENGVFTGLKSLEDLIVPSSVSTIKKFAINGCSNLSTLTIEGDLQSIDTDVLTGCANLTCVTLSNLPESMIFGYLFWATGTNYKDDKCPPSLKTVIITNATIIYSSTFRDCRNIETIVLPNNLSAIESSAFSGCSKLTNIVIPNGVKTIGEYAFYQCSNLSTIIIPSSVEIIGNQAFDAQKIKWAGNTGYGTGTSALTAYTELLEKPEGWDNNWIGVSDVVWDYKNNDISEKGLIYVVVDGVKYAIQDEQAFVCTQPLFLSLTQVKINAKVSYKDKQYDVVKIIAGAFAYNDLLEELIIPATLKAIEYSAFNGCNKLKVVYNEHSGYWYYNVSVGSSNTPFTSATEYRYSANKPTSGGRYWRYVDGIPAAWD